MSEPDERPHRAGVVALLGRPNAGKSTLLNCLLGEKLAIVTRKPQTTRSRILGILTRPDAQLLLLDTPGFHESGKALNRALNELALESASDCDVAVLLVDPRTPWDAAHEALAAGLRRRGAPVLVVGTKADLGRAREDEAPIDLLVSAQEGEGVEDLVERIVLLLPESPAYYGPDDLTDRSMRFLAAELVREALFEVLSQELPYETAVEIQRFDERDPAITRIEAQLLVERNSQKGMVVGKGGATVREIGIRARGSLEEWLGRQVHLALRVKVEPKWSRRPNRLKSLGYH